MTAYYNEIEPYAVEWLHNLILCEQISDGHADSRSILDVRPNDLLEHNRCHFFAGIGVWDYALQLAGWPDAVPVWTGSCPCQPFSTAGKSLGFADERHLWPAWYHLIGECRPPIVFGEQVASKAAGNWIDLVQDDMEALGYAFGAIAFPACSVGAPHIRQRAYWVAYADQGRSRWNTRAISGAQGKAERSVRSESHSAEPRGADCTLAHHHHHHSGCSEQRCTRLLDGERSAQRHDSDGRGADGLAVSESLGRRSGRAAEEGQRLPPREPRGPSDDRSPVANGDGERLEVGSLESAWSEREAAERGGLLEPWRDLEWVACSDGKARPTQPGLFPLAHGAPARVGRLRAYGNAIVAPQAAVFIRTVMEHLGL